MCAEQLWLPWAVPDECLVVCLGILVLCRLYDRRRVGGFMDVLGGGRSGGTKCMQAEATGPAASAGSVRARHARTRMQRR